MKHIKLGQVLIAFSLSLLVFIGTYFTENSRYKQVSSVRSPFEQAIRMKTNITIGAGQPAQNLLNQTGEFWYILPETELLLNNQQRELRKGKIVMSANFISTHDQKIAKSNFIHQSGNESFQPLVGQIKVGELIISAPKSTFWVNYDTIKEEIHVYAHDHAIDIFLPNAATPFVIPPPEQNFYQNQIYRSYWKALLHQTQKRIQHDPYNRKK